MRTQPLDRWAPIGFLTHAPQLRTHPSSTHLLCPCKPSYQRARCTCSYQKQPEPCPPMLRRRRPQTKTIHAIGNQTVLPLLWRAGHRAQSPSTGPEGAAGADQAGAQGQVPHQMCTSLAVAQEAPISQRGLRARQVVSYFSQSQRTSTALLVPDVRPISQRKPARWGNGPSGAVKGR